jgi:hypothetical protein
LDVAANAPAQLLQTLQKRGKTCLCLAIFGSERHKHADALHGSALLRAGGKRP